MTIPERLRSAGIPVAPIPRIPCGGADALREAVVARADAVIINGVTDRWPARSTWTPAQLEARYGNREVRPLVSLPGSGVLFPQDQARYERSMALAEFVRLMLETGASAPCYLAYKRANDIFPESDYDFRSLLGESDVETDTRVWLGSAGTRSMFHSDLKDNLFCQIWGRKMVTLLPWRDSLAAYPFSNNLVNSRVDLLASDFMRFPRMRRATFYYGEMEPGDILYIPRGWWHDIRSASPSISLSHWFGEPQPFKEYRRLLWALGPRAWLATLRDFVVHGLCNRPNGTRFFFSPASTGRRLYDAIRHRNFSLDNDPTT